MLILNVYIMSLLYSFTGRKTILNITNLAVSIYLLKKLSRQATNESIIIDTLI